MTWVFLVNDVKASFSTNQLVVRATFLYRWFCFHDWLLCVYFSGL